MPEVRTSKRGEEKEEETEGERERWCSVRWQSGNGFFLWRWSVWPIRSRASSPLLSALLFPPSPPLAKLHARRHVRASGSVAKEGKVEQAQHEGTLKQRHVLQRLQRLHVWSTPQPWGLC